MVNFIAQNGSDKIYYQVAAGVFAYATYYRDFAPLKQIKDNYPKYVLSMDELPMGEDGIKQQNFIDFFME